MPNILSFSSIKALIIAALSVSFTLFNIKSISVRVRRYSYEYHQIFLLTLLQVLHALEYERSKKAASVSIKSNTSLFGIFKLLTNNGLAPTLYLPSRSKPYPAIPSPSCHLASFSVI